VYIYKKTQRTFKPIYAVIKRKIIPFARNVFISFSEHFSKIIKYVLQTIGTFLVTNKYTRQYFDKHGWLANSYRSLIKFIEKKPQSFTSNNLWPNRRCIYFDPSFDASICCSRLDSNKLGRWSWLKHNQSIQ
jgi:hypothetical protein